MKRAPLIATALLAGIFPLLRAQPDADIPPPSETAPSRIRIPLDSDREAPVNTNVEDEDEQAAIQIAAQAQGWVPRGTSGVIKRGMQIRVSVMIQGNVVHASEPQRINESGLIGLPLLNNIFVADKSVEAIEKDLTQAYKEFYREPLLNVEFVGSTEDPSESPWGFVILQGNVASPGPLAMPPTGNLTVSGALKKAGGLAESAKEGSIRIYRPNPVENTVDRIEVDLVNLGRRGKHREDVTLYAGDVIYVPERIF